MVKIGRKIVCIISLVSLISIPCSARKVDDKFIDSNEWTYITSETKEKDTDYAAVKITEIYKSSGAASNYEKVKIQLGRKGEQGYSKTAEKGKLCKLKLTNKYKKEGRTISFYGQGNNPKLDCIIDGDFQADSN
jgi:hypothetical protein